MPEKSLVNALLKGKCPRCREGSMFTYRVTNLGRFNRMNDHCPLCDQRLEPEPGFYQGAMYVGYAFTILVMLMIGVGLYLLSNPPDVVYIGTVIGVMILLAPLNYRYSRIVYLYAFGGIRYDPTWSK
jgi:uncharacterized protein (DUF983 family)